MDRRIVAVGLVLPSMAMAATLASMGLLWYGSPRLAAQVAVATLVLLAVAAIVVLSMGAEDDPVVGMVALGAVSFALLASMVAGSTVLLVLTAVAMVLVPLRRLL